MNSRIEVVQARKEAPDLYMIDGTRSTNRIAAFDMDGTIITTIKAKFFKDSSDWSILPYRIPVLKHYYASGYNVVFFTNQKYKGKKLTAALERISNVSNYLREQGLDHWVFISTGENLYRKPETGMWMRLQSRISLPIDLQNSFYCGDAAGRPADFSDSDAQFASNCGVPFYLPEQLFVNESISLSLVQNLIILVGMPGVGKTTYYNQLVAANPNFEWVHASQDILKTKRKVISTTKTALISGKSVVVDATNPSPAGRADYINLAIQYNVPTVIVYIVGNGHGRNSLRENPTPTVAYSNYYKNLVEPSEEVDDVPVLKIYQ